MSPGAAFRQAAGLPQSDQKAFFSNFGPEIATRLAADIPGAAGLHWMTRSAHLPMLEEPEAYTTAVLEFFLSGKTAEKARHALHEARRQVSQLQAAR